MLKDNSTNLKSRDQISTVH